MKITYKENNVCEWEDGMCVYTIADIQKYVNGLKNFTSSEKEKDKLTVAEYQAIIQEIQAWKDIIGLINRIKVCN